MVAPDISVVILCYRAEDFVPVFVSEMKAALEKQGVRYELVLVANYHPHAQPADRTPEIATALAREDPTITVVARAKEGMMGWDMRSGLAAARGRTVAVIDGDGQMPPGDVVAVYDHLQSGGFDMVKTYRTRRGDGVLRAVVSHVFNGALTLLFPSVRVRDANSKPKIFTHEALSRLSLSADNWFLDAEIVIQASRLGFRIGEVPTIFLQNPRRASFINVRAILRFALDLLTYRLKTLWSRGRPSGS
jgi:glycosyltransferase involved in cell wall biosynthesis